MRAIKEMLSSDDSEVVYTAVSMLHYSKIKNAKKLLSEIPLQKRIRSYQDICAELGVEEVKEESLMLLEPITRKKTLAFLKIQNICKCFSGSWIPDFNNTSENKYYPYFYKKSGRWVFHGSGSDGGCFIGAVGFYKNREDSDFCGKLFQDIYIDLLG